ncbi:AAA family ATPase [Kitasatospora sp. NPDC057015]|uniref:AAA family ATPase n=1 Tax=Kitasatospora sp. NPDC057015 TaxID=3346001 RepID=UPI003644C121
MTQYPGGGQLPPRPVTPPATPTAPAPQTGPVPAAGPLGAPQPAAGPQSVAAVGPGPQPAPAPAPLVPPAAAPARGAGPLFAAPTAAGPPGGHPAPRHPYGDPALRARSAPGPAGPPAPAGATGHFLLPSGAPVQLPAHPQPHAPTGPIAVLLIGPAGAGKTTVARHWAERRPSPTAHISLDDVREWVQSGFANPQSGWNNASEAQYRLARRTCGFACRNYLANGISCIIDDAVFPDRPAIGLGGWKRHIGPGMIPVVLLPGLDSVLARNARRSGNRRLSDEEVARIHGRMAGWYNSGLPIIDNSQLDVGATAAALDQVILARLLGRPVR